MVVRVFGKSIVFSELDPFKDLTPVAGSVYEVIKGQDQKGKMDVAKAKVLLSKQLIAAWLNVQSGIGATDDDEVTCGSMDAALWQHATVYLSKVSGAETLFDAPTMSVIKVFGGCRNNILGFIIDSKGAAACQECSRPDEQCSE